MAEVPDIGNKRICFVNSNKSWGGGEKWHYDVATRLYRMGGDVHFIAGKGTSLAAKIKDKGLPVTEISISNWSVLNPRKLLQLRSLIRSIQPDIMILNLPSDVKTVGLIARFIHVPRIIYRRGSAIPIRSTFLNRFLLKRILTDILVNSNETRRTINDAHAGIFDDDKIKVVYNGLNFSVLDGMKDEALFSRQQGEVVIGNLSRLAGQKAQHLLIEVAERLKNRNKQFKVVIGGEGERREYLETLIRDKGLENHVFLPGFIQNIKAFMKGIDIFALPSLWEGFGYVMAEAMYFKKPVVAFNTSSNPEVVKDGKTGLLAKYKDIEDFYQKMLYLIDHADERKRMGEEGYSHVVRHFDFDRNFRQLTEYLYK